MESYNICYFVTSLFHVAFMYELFYEHLFSFLMGIYLGAELLGHMATLCLTFEKPLKHFFQSGHIIYIPTIKYWVFQFFHILTNICYAFCL